MVSGFWNLSRLALAMQQQQFTTVVCRRLGATIKGAEPLRCDSSR